MSESLRYVTNEQGKKVAVLLDLDKYQRLCNQSEVDPDILNDLSTSELQALPESMLAFTTQTRLDELLADNAEKQLSEAETVELDQLLEQVDQLNILKTRARYTLDQQRRKAKAV